MTESKRNTKEKYRKVGSDMKKVDAYVLGPSDYEDIPELTEEWFAKATLHIGGKPLPRGRPKSANPKEHVNMRLDRDVLAHFRAGGPGWQSRINATLRKAAKLDPAKKRSRG
jgi:uncharacterized protein (DUF4415 family)